MTTDLPPGWVWSSVTRLRREYIRADQLDAPYASTSERRADLGEARARIIEEAAAIVAAQLAIERKPYQECKKHGTFYNPKCYHCRRRRPDRRRRRSQE